MNGYMTNFNFQSGEGDSAPRFRLRAGNIFFFVFALPFAGIGCFFLWNGAKDLLAGQAKSGLFDFLFGLVFAGVGFGLMFAAGTAARREAATGAKWLARDDWAEGKIKSAAGSQWKFFLFMGAMFCAIGCTVSFFVLKEELPRHNYTFLFVLIFPLVGFGFLIAAVRALLAHRRFGDCFFQLAQVPAPLGGSLDGIIQTSRLLRFEQGLHLKLSCIRRTVVHNADKGGVDETVLWQDEKFFRHDAGLPATVEGGTGIPVHFALPANMPESSLRGDDTTHWKLDAKAKMSGLDFTALFEVPVFHVAGVVAADQPDVDPTAALQMSAEEIRREEHSKIQVADGRNGREFYFPAARNPGRAFVITTILPVWGLLLWILIAKDAPIIFPIFFGVIGFFLLWSCMTLWTKSIRVTVNSSEVAWENRWLIFGRTRRMAADEILRFDLTGLPIGQTLFYDVKLVTRGNQDGFPAAFNRGGITIAGGIPSKPEADWLVQEMNKALGRFNRDRAGSESLSGCPATHSTTWVSRSSFTRFSFKKADNIGG
jgi:hypothetical protein